MAMAREVWFQLVNAEGKPVTSPYRVKLADGAQVVDLQDAVKQHCDKYSDLLKGLLPSDLTVYATTNGVKQKLEEDSPIGARGGSQKDALIVEVPQRQRERHFGDWILT
ncbi:hypothetical protein ATCC90586_011469 [Pythium insidiosum]|nr:hypothetical protein ATCC90586_011469 [Pythium insidiosum]